MTKALPNVATVMTDRNLPPGPDNDMVAHTPAGEPNIKVLTQPWYLMILIRVARVYIQTLVGLAGVDFASTRIDFSGLGEIAVLAGSAAFISLLQNTGEILSQLDSNESYAKYRA